MVWMPSTTNIQTRGLARAHPGWLGLIARRPELSLLNCKPEQVVMTPNLFWQMSMVNTKVNNRVRYVKDHGDYWRVANTTGDCEDYAIAKDVELRKLGWPPGALRITVCMIRNSRPAQAHAVLMIETDHGTWVIDNMARFPTRWIRCPYYWLYRVLPGNKMWERLVNY